jgi:hypothetical protein
MRQTENTFLCWVVSNIEIACAVAFWIIGSLIILIVGVEYEKMSKLAAMGVLAVLLAITCAQGKQRFFSLIKYLIIVIAIAALIFTPEMEMEENMKDNPLYLYRNLLFASLIIGAIFGIFVAIYANRNIDEVISRRMLYRNSNVALFEVRWLYIVDRFAAAASAITLDVMVVLMLLVMP